MRLCRMSVAFCLAIACARSNPADPPGIVGRVHLARAATCESLARAVQDTAVRQMQSQLEEWSRLRPMPGIISVAGGPTPAPAGAPASYSTTNVQVAGVDEADFVKNDGTRILVLSGRTLFAATSWPPADLSVAGKLEIEGWPTSMFLDGDRVVVFSSIWTSEAGPWNGESFAPCPSGGCWSLATTKITVVDVRSLSAPAALAEVYLPGYAAGARRIGRSVRLVLGDSVRWPQKIQWGLPYDPALFSDPTRFALALGALEHANEAIIRATPLESWFPKGARKLPDGTTVDIGYRCTDFYLSNAPERLGLVTVATLDLANLDAGVARSSILSEPGVLYATADHLYLATRHWWWWAMTGQRDWTYLHAFDVSDPATASYIGSGGVEGVVNDQFALDEHRGYLRVATSTTRYSGDPADPRSFHLELGSRLTVLGAAPGGDGGTSLTPVGEISSLVEGERLMATRFTGDRGYGVTFRYVDPLVTLDLSDPTRPKKVAELTLPGFSTYLQPIDDAHLLAIGIDLPLDQGGHPDWNKRAMQLSVFDVSNLAEPKRSAQVTVGTGWASSEALWDHHAFNWYRPDPSRPGLLAIPFSDWVQAAPGTPWWTGFVSDVRMFSVDAAAGITPLGSLSMGDVYIQQGTGNWSWWYRPWVRRSVLATDQAGRTFAYAVSDAGVRAAALDRLDVPIATALFPRTP